LALVVLVLVVLGTGCEPVNTALETKQTEAESDLARAQGQADATRIQAEADAEAKQRVAEAEAEAAVIEAEAQAMEAEASANEAKAATTEALAVLEQAHGDRTVKEALANQVNSITGVLEATTGTLRTLAVAVVALVVIFALGVGGMLFMSWRGQQQVAQVPGRYILVQDPEAAKALSQDRRTALLPASLRPIEQSRRRG
jgi:F0F1-type ATP synthase membrane subunit b/b'